jgi:hypothetical protein
LAVLVLFVVLGARISLGKNIGFVPAQRELVSSGAYAATPHDMGSQGYDRGHDTNMRVIIGPREVAQAVRDAAISVLLERAKLDINAASSNQTCHLD